MGRQNRRARLAQETTKALETEEEVRKTAAKAFEKGKQFNSDCMLQMIVCCRKIFLWLRSI